MQIIISILIVGLLWMIYDLINAPEVDEDENYILPENSDEEEDIEEEPVVEKPVRKPRKKASKID